MKTDKIIRSTEWIGCPIRLSAKGQSGISVLRFGEEINLAITELGQSEFQHLVKFLNHNLQVTHVM